MLSFIIIKMLTAFLSVIRDIENSSIWPHLLMSERVMTDSCSIELRNFSFSVFWKMNRRKGSMKKHRALLFLRKDFHSMFSAVIWSGLVT